LRLCLGRRLSFARDLRDRVSAAAWPAAASALGATEISAAGAASVTAARLSAAVAGTNGFGCAALMAEGPVSSTLVLPCRERAIAARISAAPIPAAAPSLLHERGLVFLVATFSPTEALSVEGPLADSASSGDSRDSTWPSELDASATALA
jgi:hypothetical protein